MKPQSLADFMFTGVVIIPGVLAWSDEIGLALFTLVALLIAACLCGWQEQVDAAEGETTQGNGADVKSRKPPASGSPLHRTRNADHDQPGMRQ